MQERSSTPLTDEYLQSFAGMQPADPGPFFYTRLKGRMQQQQNQTGFFYKPAWVIAALCFFLTINAWMIIQEKGSGQQTTNEKTSPVQAFAETYNLDNNSNY